MSAKNTTPILKVLAPFLLGILLSTSIYYQAITVGFASLAIALFIGKVLTKKTLLSIRLGMLSSISMFVALGIAYAGWFGSTHVSLPEKTETKQVILVHEYEIREGKSNRIFGEILNSDLPKGKRGVVVYTPNIQNIHPNDTVYFPYSLKPIESFELSKHFNFKTYLNKKGYYYQGYSKNELQFLSNSSTSLQKLIYEWRERLKFRISTFLQPENVALAQALLLGDKDLLEDNDIKAFANTGLMHVLAVSGLHVGIFVLLFQKLIRFFLPFWKQRKVRLVLLLSVILTYVLLTGASESVQRAGIMMSFYLVSTESNLGKTNKWNVLFSSMFILLLINPLAIYSMGFQFSYLAVFGIMALFQPINERVSMKGFLPKKIFELCLVSLIAQLFTAPLALYYFGTFPSYFLLSNLLVLPLIFCVVSVGSVFIFFSEFTIPAKFLGLILDSLLSFTRFIVERLSTLPNSLIQVELISEYLLLVLYILIAAIALAFLKRKQARTMAR